MAVYIAIALNLAIGISLLVFNWGLGLRIFSYDTPFFFISRPPPEDIVIIYLDEVSHSALNQPFDKPWDRQLHADLINNLHKDGAKQIFFDMLFDEEGPNPEADDALAEAIRNHGNVILAAEFVDRGEKDFDAARIFPPLRKFRKAGAKWGRITFRHETKERSVQELWLGETDDEEIHNRFAVWEAFLTSGFQNEANPLIRAEERWLNYYGPPGTIPNYSYSRALEKQSTGTFKDKFVFVGGRQSSGYSGSGKDEFAGPYSRFGQGFSPGVELHTTGFANLINREWLKQIPIDVQLALTILWGIFASIVLQTFRPVKATVAAFICFIAGSCICIVIQYKYLFWWAWIIPIGIQTLVAWSWSLIYNFIIELDRERLLRSALGAYVSPETANQIIKHEFDLSLGGQNKNLTILFTDLKGFTSMSEKLPAKEVSKILNEYFTATTSHIHDLNGTVSKYIGDAVMAIWGAPIEIPDQADKAVAAACRMIEASSGEIQGQELYTRIGINSGKVLYGNLGSRQKMDLTVIGDNVNLAARLEAINKYFGTHIIISESTKNQLTQKFLIRDLGRYRVVGKTEPIRIYEVLRPMEADEPDPDYMQTFHNARSHFEDRKFDEAITLFTKCNLMQNEEDGPAQFFLKKIEQLRPEIENDPNWDGVITFDSK